MIFYEFIIDAKGNAGSQTGKQRRDCRHRVFDLRASGMLS
jgi:hypothetical protein